MVALQRAIAVAEVALTVDAIDALLRQFSTLAHSSHPLAKTM